MEFTKGIRSLLSNNINVRNSVSTRIYPITAPQGATLPFIVYDVISTNTVHSKDALEHTMSRIEVILFSDSYSEAVTVGRYMQDALNRQSYNSGGIVIDALFTSDIEIEQIEDPSRYAFVLELEAFIPA